MTSQEMAYNFELKLGEQDKIGKSFITTDVNIFLNKAQDELIEGFYSARIRPESRYFEMDERARAMLAYLIENEVITSFDDAHAALHPNAVMATLPSNFLYALKENVTVAYTDCNNDVATKRSRVKPVTHDEYEMTINNTFKKPYRDLIWRMDYSGSNGQKKHELIAADGVTITTYRLRYLRKPLAINVLTGVDCELHTMLHEEVVDRAVAYALRSKQAEEMQVKENIEQ